MSPDGGATFAFFFTFSLCGGAVSWCFSQPRPCRTRVGFLRTEEATGISRLREGVIFRRRRCRARSRLSYGCPPVAPGRRRCAAHLARGSSDRRARSLYPELVGPCGGLVTGDFSAASTPLSASGIAIEGCCHGELDAIYRTLARIEEKHNIKIDLLICCGDFQCVRDASDLQYLACPPKYRDLKDFPAYYQGEKEAYCLTVFVGGNHEAPSVLRELYYGGWVAPKIFYLGHAGVIKVGGLRIAGLSGIYKQQDYKKGYFERPPYDDNTMRSAYHVREFEISKLSVLSGRLDIVATHDWPEGIYEFGDKAELLRFKPFLEKDIQAHVLGNPHTMELLKKLKPSFWCAAHLHAQFAAVYVHPEPEGKATRFLALDKVLPCRRFLQILEVDPDLPAGYVQTLSPDLGRQSMDPQICYDRQWLAILRANQRRIPTHRSPHQSTTAIPPSAEDVAAVERNLENAGLKRTRLRSNGGLHLKVLSAAAVAPNSASADRPLQQEDALAPAAEPSTSAAPDEPRCGSPCAQRRSGGARGPGGASPSPRDHGAADEVGFAWPDWADARAPYRDLKRQRLFLLKLLGFDEADDKFGDAPPAPVEDIEIPVNWGTTASAQPKTTEELDICLDISDEEEEASDANCEVPA
ncbi:Ser/Thr phosphatase family protein [Besnoitia besnoiti]|uniref:Ser/Thr phosphatase family protein n=1 Tax=Besnoitia besnoiti TaxID=94643 RepID=A0A2A9MBA2_BESBE|nr:Ser/Thr phosphatase family protein [Besnoitia besnoiti]PFH32953.1 Ser/Thr phosphatase family protein [Besnoitia besnoiti]